jgi:hypothetical protein
MAVASTQAVFHNTNPKVGLTFVEARRSDTDSNREDEKLTRETFLQFGLQIPRAKQCN